VPHRFLSFLLLISLFPLIPACRAQSHPVNVRDYIYGPGGRLIMTAEPDVYPPTTPTWISAIANGYAEDGVTVSWDNGSTDIGSGVGSYYLYKNGGFLSAFDPSVSSYTDYDIYGGDHITYSVAAVDNAGNVSGKVSASVTVPIYIYRLFPWDLFSDGKRVLFAGLRLLGIQRKASPGSSWVIIRSKQPGGSGQSPSSAPAPPNKFQPISFDIKRIALPGRRSDTGLLKLGEFGKTSPPATSSSIGGGR